MYSISENLDATEFSGWINQDLLLKNSGRTTASVKRRYELTNVDIDDNCDDSQLRVLRPRHNVDSQTSPGASRTRPIRSNRSRRRPIVPLTDYNGTTTEQHLSQTQTGHSVMDSTLPASYNWPRNYLVAHTNPPVVPRVEPATFSHRLGIQIPQFDPWMLQNYLLASPAYSTIAAAHLLQDSNQEEQSRNMSQLGYRTMVSENPLNHNFIWQYPFILSPALDQIQNQVTWPSELAASTSYQNVATYPDSSYLYQPANLSQADVSSNSNESNHRTDRIFQNDHSSATFHNDVLPIPFNYPSLCPYHNTNHIVQNNQQNLHAIANSISNLSEPPPSQRTQLPQLFSTPSINHFQNSPEINFGHYWPQITPIIRPLNYPINSSNIDTLLHLAAHFEQRKRGITREELDKLPTHRHKIAAEKSKRMKLNTNPAKVDTDDNAQKCLVCLEEFESKQSIRTLRCTHEFHAKCIDKWLKINRTCPLCRADSVDGSAQIDGP